MRVAVVTALCVAAGAAPANATVFNVTKQTDGGGACLVGNCSLRAAVLASNAAPGTNTINVPPGDYTLTVTGASEDAAATGDLDVLHGDVTIVGTGGAAMTTIHGSGDRIFDVPATGANPSALTLSGLTLTGGGAVRFGAAVEVDTRTKLTLSHDVVTTNATTDGGRGAGVDYAPTDTGSGYEMVVAGSTFSNNVTGGATLQGASGGAIAWVPAGGTGALTVTDSTFTNNVATSTRIGQNAFGGAIAADPGHGTVQIAGSAFTANSATNIQGTGGSGGAIWFVPETDTDSALTVINSTFTANSAAGSAGHGAGGAIQLENGAETATLTNDTFSANTATGPGGALDNGGRLTPSNTIFWANTSGGAAGTCSHPVVATGGTSGGYNIASDLTCGLGAAGDSGADPHLLALADNGGPTQTMALGDASGALDKIPGSSCPAVDQRGVVRPQGGACDIGAFEAIAPPPLAPVAPIQPVQPINPVTPITPITKPAAKLTVATHYTHNHDGSIMISATVNGAGTIRVRDATPTGRHHKAQVGSLSKTVTKASTIKLTIKPSAAAKTAFVITARCRSACSSHSR